MTRAEAIELAVRRGTTPQLREVFLKRYNSYLEKSALSLWVVANINREFRRICAEDEIFDRVNDYQVASQENP